MLPDFSILSKSICYLCAVPSAKFRIAFKFKMADLSLFLFCSNWQDILFAQTQINIFLRYFTYALTTILPWILWSLPWANSKWPTSYHFCWLKLTKYLKILSILMNISNTNEYIFAILYTCIDYNLSMNPVKFRHDQIKNDFYFCLLQFTKYLKNLSVRINISNTNEYFFAILNTFFSYYNLQQNILPGGGYHCVSHILV